MEKIMSKKIKRILYSALLIIVIAFFTVPSMIFAEGENTGGQVLENSDGQALETVATQSASEQPAEPDVTADTGAEITPSQQPEEQSTEETVIESADKTVEEEIKPEVIYTPLISTDKEDYNPGEAVTVFGTGFKPQDTITVSFFKATGELEFLSNIISDNSGNFIFTYNILGSPEYKVIARSESTEMSADTIFKDRATANFKGHGPRLTGSQFYEEIMYVDIHRDLTPAGTDDNMIAFCIDLQHYLTDYPGDDFDVYSFLEYNADNGIPSGKKDPSLTWPLPASIQALANSFDAGWFTADPGAGADLDGDSLYTANEKAAAMQEAFWHLVSAASPTDSNTFDYTVHGISGIRPLVASILARVTNIAASVAINPATDINYLKDNNIEELDLNSHLLTVDVRNYFGAGIAAPVYLTITGQGYFLAGGSKSATASLTTAADGTANIYIYADKNTFSGISSVDNISAFVDVNGNGTYNVSPYLTPGGSILYPKIATFPESKPSGSNQLLILTNLLEPATSVSKEWRVPGEIYVHKIDGVDGTNLAGAVISLLDGTGNAATDAWGNPIDPQTTGSDGNIAGFKGLAWGDYQVKEDLAPAGYYTAENIPVSISSGSLRTLISEKLKAINDQIEPESGIRVKVDMKDARMPGQLKITKTDTLTGLPVAGATYNIFDNNGALVGTVVTGPDGTANVTLVSWGTYTVREESAPAGYILDMREYTVIVSSSSINVNLNVQNTPVTTTVTVAGISSPGVIEVLAFTGVAPVIPIAGISTIAGGLGLFTASLIRRRRK
ncbi:MAG: Cna protein B-type domain protein [Actinobacteria bacterium ADurb.Bin346]|nr:MAG: Cna protein B-type domain protein [Actinobacteria bacterium ADurb.Bin346]